MAKKYVLRVYDRTTGDKIASWKLDKLSSVVELSKVWDTDNTSVKAFDAEVRSRISVYQNPNGGWCPVIRKNRTAAFKQLLAELFGAPVIA